VKSEKGILNTYGVAYKAQIESQILLIPFFICILFTLNLELSKVQLISLNFLIIIGFGFLFETRKRFSKSFLKFSLLTDLPSISFLFWMSSNFLLVSEPMMFLGFVFGFFAVCLAYYSALKRAVLEKGAEYIGSD
jgi:hypothetical protein